MDDYAGTQAGLTDRPRPESPQLPRQEKIFLPGEDANIRRILRKCCTCWTQHHFPTIKISMSTPIGNFQIYQLKCDTGFMRCFACSLPLVVTETMQNMARIECHILTRFEKRFELVASLEWATDLHANEICPRWSVEKPVARLSEGKRKTEEKLK